MHGIFPGDPGWSSRKATLQNRRLQVVSNFGDLAKYTGARKWAPTRRRVTREDFGDGQLDCLQGPIFRESIAVVRFTLQTAAIVESVNLLKGFVSGRQRGVKHSHPPPHVI